MQGNGLSFVELDAIEAVARGHEAPLDGQLQWRLQPDEAINLRDFD